jgi:hypothetical protein
LSRQHAHFKCDVAVILLLLLLLLCILQVHNEGGAKRVVVTKNLPGERWLQILTAAGCRVEVSP